jgi:hypothetical protein
MNIFVIFKTKIFIPNLRKYKNIDEITKQYNFYAQKQCASIICGTKFKFMLPRYKMIV